MFKISKAALRHLYITGQSSPTLCSFAIDGEKRPWGRQ
jgi:hypothetical protein